MNQNLNAAIKTRVEARDKLTLQHIASQDGLELSDIIRRALKDYIRARSRREQSATQKQEELNVHA